MTKRVKALPLPILGTIVVEQFSGQIAVPR
jgi:hypothetical protein